MTEPARRDPGWLRVYWPVFLFGVLLAFGAPEAVGVVAPGTGGTLSEMTREWLGVGSDGSITTIRWVALTAALIGFAVWFPVHLRKWWPWERPRS